MSQNQLKIFTSDNQYPVGDPQVYSKKKLVQIRQGPNRKLLSKIRQIKFEKFSWDQVRSLVDHNTDETEYKNFFWDSYLGYEQPISRTLYIDAAADFYFKFENEWKFAVKSKDLGSLAKVNIQGSPTIHEHYGSVYCFYTDVVSAPR